MAVRCLQCRWSASKPVLMPEGGTDIASGMSECNLHTNRTEDSIMDVLNIVLDVLHLLAETITLTWLISRDVFRDTPKAKHYSYDKK